jgi:hypothetical protein
MNCVEVRRVNKYNAGKADIDKFRIMLCKWQKTAIFFTGADIKFAGKAANGGR